MAAPSQRRRHISTQQRLSGKQHQPHRASPRAINFLMKAICIDSPIAPSSNPPGVIIAMPMAHTAPLYAACVPGCAGSAGHLSSFHSAARAGWPRYSSRSAGSADCRRSPAGAQGSWPAPEGQKECDPSTTPPGVASDCGEEGTETQPPWGGGGPQTQKGDGPKLDRSGDRSTRACISRSAVRMLFHELPSARGECGNGCNISWTIVHCSSLL